MAWLGAVQAGQWYMLSVVHSQYHVCCCTGDLRSQCISRHGIDPTNIPSPAPEVLKLKSDYMKPWQWRHNERDGVWNIRRIYCLFNCWFRRRSKKTSKLRVTGQMTKWHHITKFGTCIYTEPAFEGFRLAMIHCSWFISTSKNNRTSPFF